MTGLSPRDDLLTPAQVANLLDLPAGVVARFINSGVLEAHELRPGVVRIYRAALATFIDQHPWLRSVVRDPPQPKTMRPVLRSAGQGVLAAMNVPGRAHGDGHPVDRGDAWRLRKGR